MIVAELQVDRLTGCYALTVYCVCLCLRVGAQERAGTTRDMHAHAFTYAPLRKRALPMHVRAHGLRHATTCRDVLRHAATHYCNCASDDHMHTHAYRCAPMHSGSQARIQTHECTYIPNHRRASYHMCVYEHMRTHAHIYAQNRMSTCAEAL